MAMRRFASVAGNRILPDEIMILNFQRLLAPHDLAPLIPATRQGQSASGSCMCTGLQMEPNPASMLAVPHAIR